MLSLVGLSRRYIWFGCLHVMTGTFFLAIFELLLHLISISIYPALVLQVNLAWLKSRTNYLSFLTFVQWEQLVSDIYKPQIFISKYNKSFDNADNSNVLGSYGKTLYRLLTRQELRRNCHVLILHI